MFSRVCVCVPVSWRLEDGLMCLHTRLDSTSEGDRANGIFTEVDRAIDNLVKSGKMFNVPGRRDSVPMSGATRTFPEQFGKNPEPAYIQFII